jgi:hypothetical protein
MKLYAAGFLEGWATASRIAEFHGNLQALANQDGKAEAMANVKAMMLKALEHTRQNVGFQGGADALAAPSNPYWRHAQLILFQLCGLRDGYNLNATSRGDAPLSMIDLFILNSHATFAELLDAYSPEAVKSRFTAQAVAPTVDSQQAALAAAAAAQAGGWRGSSSWLDHLSDDEWEQRLARQGRASASAFVRLASGNKDILVGHTTWGDYSKMTRIFKYYNFSLPDDWGAMAVSGFSSYPGCVSSTDNFFILENGLVVMDAPFEVLDPNAYDAMPASTVQVPNFLHVMVVNRLATSGSHWASLYAAGSHTGQPSGGLNSAQWIVVDYQRFATGEVITENTVWIVEQIADEIRTKDVSSMLNSKGYWASYDRPYNVDVRELSGHAAAEQRLGLRDPVLYSYDGAPRAQIFRQRAEHVENLFNLRRTMTRNAFPTDDVKPNRPSHAISARMDIDRALGSIPHGGIDAKVTNRCLARALQCQAISGPTHDGQPAFNWQAFPSWPHRGLPDAWSFNWRQMTPDALSPEKIADTLSVCPEYPR